MQLFMSGDFFFPFSTVLPSRLTMGGGGEVDGATGEAKGLTQEYLVSHVV